MKEKGSLERQPRCSDKGMQAEGETDSNRGLIDKQDSHGGTPSIFRVFPSMQHADILVELLFGPSQHQFHKHTHVVIHTVKALF